MRQTMRLVGVGLATAICTQAYGSPQVLFADAMQKIPDASTINFEQMSSPSFFAAQNEFEAFQVVIHGDGQNVYHNVSIVPADLTGSGGTITAAYCDAAGVGHDGDVRVYLEDLIDITNSAATNLSSDLHGLTGEIPDPLIPQVDEFDNECRDATISTLNTNETRVFWIEAFVPAGTPAGTYTGSFRAIWDGGGTTFNVQLTVWDFTLPSTASLRSTFDINPLELATGFGMPDAGPSQIDQLLKRFSTLGLDHRISISNFDDRGADPAADGLSAYWTAFGPLISGTADTRLQGAELTTVRFINTGGHWSESDLAT